jgi:undecaprenyl-diphosphatase
MVAIETRPASAATRGRATGGAAVASLSGWTLGATPGAASFDPVSAALLGSRTMTPMQAAILGVIQGLSEFLPISSSAHLALSHWLFGWGDPADNVPFDVALHLGTLLAVLLYFRKDLLEIVRGSFAAVRGRRDTPELRLALYLVLASLPAIVLGLAFKDTFERMHDWPPLMAATLAGVGLVLFAVDRRPAGDRTVVTTGSSLVIGTLQAAALVPGVSRSGITIVGGLLCGLTRPAAARFSFLLSIPAILGAVVLNAKHIVDGDPAVVLSGMVAAAVSGYLAIGFLLRHIGRTGFAPYAIYRIALAAFILFWWLTRTST